MSSAPSTTTDTAAEFARRQSGDSKVNPIGPKSETGLPVFGNRAGFGSGAAGDNRNAAIALIPSPFLFSSVFISRLPFIE